MNLDREMTPSYRLVAQATDGGGRSCRSEVHLTVSDVNDNPPKFSLSHYTASVFEDTATKALLTRIQAIDPDEGDTILAITTTNNAVVLLRYKLKIKVNLGTVSF